MRKRKKKKKMAMSVERMIRDVAYLHLAVFTHSQKEQPDYPGAVPGLALTLAQSTAMSLHSATLRTLCNCRYTVTWYMYTQVIIP